MSCRLQQFLLVLIALTLVLSGCSASSSVPETTLSTDTPAPQATVATTSASTGLKTPPVREVNGHELYSVDDNLYHTALGAPILGRDKIAELYKADDLQKAAEQITNVGDALYYIRQTRRFEGPAQACRVFLTLIDGDYASVGLIEYYYSDNYYCLVYVEDDGKFYALDPFTPYEIWIHYVKTNFSNSDLNTLAKDLQESFPRKGSELVGIIISEYKNTPHGAPMLMINGQEFYSIDGALYPRALGAPILGRDKVAELYKAGNFQEAAEQITHVGDALHYMQQGGQMENPEIACAAFSVLIGGDYKTVGAIEFDYTDTQYFLVYVEYDGKFYVFDPMEPTYNWMYPDGTKFSHSDIKVLAEELQNIFPHKGSKLLEIQVSVNSISPHTVNSLDGILYPKVFGAPVLGKEKVSELYTAGDLQKTAEQITHIGDAMYYMLQAGRLEDPLKACQVFSTLIDGDYASVGMIELFYSDNRYTFVYVEYNGTFYAFDPFNPTRNWIYLHGTNYGNSSAEALAENLHEFVPNKGTRLIATQINANQTDPNEEKVYAYIGTTFPEGLGQPVLSDAQIDALIAEQDYAKTAETITTLADAVNYYRRAGIVFHENNDINPVGDLCYYQSAWQVLKDRQGQCVTMSNLNHYLLTGDYDEIGYVEVNSPGDGHVMTYILEDGKYYLVNSVDYTEKQLFDWWENNPGLLWCAADFQEIADSLVKNMRLGDRELVDRVFLINSPGDFVFARRDNKALYPEGCQATQYYGYGITYEKATIDWISQTRIDY